MFSITLKRSAATLGVVAGLLAAAGPASAQLPADAGGVTTPPSGSKAPAGATWVWHEAARNGFTVEVGMGMSEDFLNAPQLGAANDVSQLSLTQKGTQIGSEGVKAPATPTANGFIIDFAHTDVKARTNAGTQVGSEGAKTPTAGTQIGIED
jgi:hypothetical protein